jgi:hypothetical protein
MSSSPATYEPTEEDFLHLLIKGHKGPNDPLKLDCIRAVLVKAHEQQNEICSAIVRQFEDPDDDHALSLVQSFNSRLPKKSSVITAHNHGLDKCSPMLVEIYNIFRSAILRKKGGTSKIPACFTPVMDMMAIVKARIFTEKINRKTSLILKVQDNRRFMSNATAPPEGYTTCVLCDHTIVDCPISNQGVKDRNDMKKQKYEQELALHNSQKTANSNTVSQFIHIPYFLLYH